MRNISWRNPDPQSIKLLEEAKVRLKCRTYTKTIEAILRENLVFSNTHRHLVFTDRNSYRHLVHFNTNPHRDMVLSHSYTHRDMVLSNTNTHRHLVLSHSHAHWDVVLANANPHHYPFPHFDPIACGRAIGRRSLAGGVLPGPGPGGSAHADAARGGDRARRHDLAGGRVLSPLDGQL